MFMVGAGERFNSLRRPMARGPRQHIQGPGGHRPAADQAAAPIALLQGYRFGGSVKDGPFEFDPDGSQIKKGGARNAAFLMNRNYLVKHRRPSAGF
jgi:hypothetical protein